MCRRRSARWQRCTPLEPRNVTASRYYMACLDLRGRDCLVVGGGRVATEKVTGCSTARPTVTVVAPRFDDELLGCRSDRPPAFHRSDVAGRFLVIAATNDRAVNMDVSSAAAEHATLCNVADDPELCSFILPAIVRRDPIVVGVSTGGASPALAQRIRADVAELIRPEHALLAERWRRCVRGPNVNSRTTKSAVTTSSLWSGRRSDERRDRRGRPRRPGLVTVRALELVQRCDVLVYDRLVSRDLVLKATGAARIAREGLTQHEVNELLVHHGRQRPRGRSPERGRPLHLRPRLRRGGCADSRRRRLRGRSRRVDVHRRLGVGRDSADRPRSRGAGDDPHRNIRRRQRSRLRPPRRHGWNASDLHGAEARRAPGSRA